MMPKFSVILPVCHGGRFLTQALSSLACASSPQGGFEVLVAGTKQTINRLPVFHSDQAELRTVKSEENRSAALNAACEAARGSVWVFADDDCVFPGDWLLNVEQSLIAHPDAAVLGGVDILASGASTFDWALDEVPHSFWGRGGACQDRCIRVGRYYPRLWNMNVLAKTAMQVALVALVTGIPLLGVVSPAGSIIVPLFF
jgi:glycosyltransferase involved in cell wall biosynthesis